MNNHTAETLEEYEKKVTASMTLLVELRDKETNPEIRAELQDEINCLAESWFAGQMLSEDKQ